jgi:thiol-disulfide isomerase/thioredoxin
MPLSRPLLLTCAFAVLVSGCDRQTKEPAQPQPTAAASPEQLAGKLDRSHAGTAMPAAELSDPAGKKLKLTELKGKPFLLNLWATWCAPCVVEMPLLDKMAGEMKDRLPVITVSEDFKGAEQVTPFFAQHGFRNLPQWLDPNNALAVGFGGGAALPLTVLYDAQGKEVWRVMGGYDWSSESARKAIAEGLKEA